MPVVMRFLRRSASPLEELWSEYSIQIWDGHQFLGANLLAIRGLVAFFISVAIPTPGYEADFCDFSR